jgi:predicted house-cleaning noncanonical NTP pyrophosphatase (MazG superfamily)
VRDKVPARIAERRESESTRQVPEAIKKGFLLAKLIEEVLEVREAATDLDKKDELADVYEVLKALISAENTSIDEVIAAADAKRNKAGGFEQGLVLLRTGLAGADNEVGKVHETEWEQILVRRVSETTYDVPFTVFGFLPLERQMIFDYEAFSVRIIFVIKKDRIQINVSRLDEQIDLDFYGLEDPTASGRKG